MEATHHEGKYAAIPEELKRLRQWMAWRKGETKANGRFDKPPVSLRGSFDGSTNNPSDWGTFEEALAFAEQHDLPGVEFVFTPDDPYCGVDLDNCRNPESEGIAGWAWEIIRELDSYTEVSPSGTGVKVFVRGSVPRSINTEHIEIYDSKQPFTVTSERVEGTPAEIRDAGPELMSLFHREVAKLPESSRDNPEIDEDDPPVRLDEYGLAVWRGEKPALKEDSPGEVDRSATLFKIGGELAEAGATRKAIRDALADRDISLRYRKFSGRPDERAELEYRRIANKVVDKAGVKKSVELAAEKDVPEVFGARWLLEEEFPPIRWVVPDILPEGVTLLAGKPKLGKSWLAMDLCLGVAHGGAVLGTKRVEGGACLYLALEDSPRRLQRRLKGLMAGGGEAGGEEAPDGFEFATEWPRVGEGCEEKLRGWLEVHPGARLVVIDTLKKVRPRTDVRKGIYDADYEALEPLLPLAAEFGVAVVVVHHTRKTPGADPLEEVSGSYGLSGGVDGVLVMKRERGSRDAFLHVTGRDIEEEAELALRWDTSMVRWTLLGNAEEHRRSEERKQISAKLGEVGEPMSATDIAIEIGKKVDGVRKLVRKMVRDGELAKVGAGSATRYALPEVVMEDEEDNEEGGVWQ
jgi:hypothetical protein